MHSTGKYTQVGMARNVHFVLDYNVKVSNAATTSDGNPTSDIQAKVHDNTKRSKLKRFTCCEFDYSNYKKPISYCWKTIIILSIEASQSLYIF